MDSFKNTDRIIIVTIISILLLVFFYLYSLPEPVDEFVFVDEYSVTVTDKYSNFYSKIARNYIVVDILEDSNKEHIKIDSRSYYFLSIGDEVIIEKYEDFSGKEIYKLKI